MDTIVKIDTGVKPDARINDFLADFNDHGYAAGHEHKSSDLESQIGIRQDNIKKNFKSKIAAYSYLIKIAGLSTDTSSCYKWFLRTITCSCAILCFTNLFFKTTGYNEPLFDITLVSFHCWICYVYEMWVRYLKTKTYKKLFTTVAYQQTAKFERQTKFLGWVGIILIPIAIFFLIAGWLSPIGNSLMNMETIDHDYIFMMFHIALMIIIIVPWSCVCFGSLFSFHFLLTAHKTDILEHFCNLFACVKNNTNIDVQVKDFRKIKYRIMFTSNYFHTTYLWFVVNGLLLMTSVIYKLSIGEPFELNQVFQYIFYTILGLLSVIIGIFSISSVNNFWKNIILDKINDLMQEIKESQIKTSSYQYYNSVNICYKFLGCDFTQNFGILILTIYMVIMLQIVSLLK